MKDFSGLRQPQRMCAVKDDFVLVFNMFQPVKRLGHQWVSAMRHQVAHPEHEGFRFDDGSTQDAYLAFVQVKANLRRLLQIGPDLLPSLKEGGSPQTA